MGFMQRLFSNMKPVVENEMQSAELRRLRELDAFMRSLLGGDHFVAKSEYRAKLLEYEELSTWFQVLQRSGTLEDYCKRNKTSQAELSGIITRFNTFEDLVDSQNEQYVKAQMMAE